MGNVARLGRLAAAAVVVIPCATARGGEMPRRGEILTRLKAGEDGAASALIDAYLRRHPDDAIMLYNAACVQCRLGSVDDGAAFLIKAIKAGFADFSAVRRDPDLRPLHDHPVYRAILSARDAADKLLAQRRMDRWKRICTDPGYRFETDEHRRLAFVTALGPDDARDVRRMLDEEAGHLHRLLGLPLRPTQTVLIVVPRPQDARRLLGKPHAAGFYHHARGELITTDTQRCLRHEFVHALHHSHMDALGQEHPLWIQEGLALLLEHVRPQPDGSLTFPANDRQDHVRMLARTGRLIPWTSLLAMSSAQLDAESARTYPQLRSMFRFLAGQGRLGSWYRRYVEDFDRDPTGVSALEAAFGKPLSTVERQWRAWLDRQPVARATLS